MTVVKGIIKKGEYYDSVSLMTAAHDTTALKGVLDAAVVMGTQENKSILKSSGLFISEFEKSSDTDLLISIKTETEKIASETLVKIDELLKNLRKKTEGGADYHPKSLDGALKILPDANLSLISVAGRYAAYEARKSLENGLHVFLFSDNVTIEQEIDLKKYGRDKGLLVMGPGCGTAIINGVPLAFANVVNRGDIGIVAAAGTGLQEVSTIISNQGSGISQAIGTGGTDVKKDVGGIMFIEALKALNDDSQTRIIVLVSKPPHESVIIKIAALLKQIKKPTVGIFLGGDPNILKQVGAIATTTLEETAMVAASLSQHKPYEGIQKSLEQRKVELKELAKSEAKKMGKGQKYLRGLFSGGTLAAEAQIIFQEYAPIYSNAPLKKDMKLADSWKSIKHSIVDMGEDEFTVGRPHPMIDYSLRNRRILDEANDPETAVILLDVVIGYGSNMTPGYELVPIFKKAKEMAHKNKKHLAIVCSICGTNNDPQNRTQVEKQLKEAGALVLPSNAAACQVARFIIENLEA